MPLCINREQHSANAACVKWWALLYNIQPLSTNWKISWALVNGMHRPVLIYFLLIRAWNICMICIAFTEIRTKHVKYPQYMKKQHLLHGKYWTKSCLCSVQIVVTGRIILQVQPSWECAQKVCLYFYLSPLSCGESSD